MLSLMIAGVTIGFAAGMKPGALGIYVIHQTMVKGKKQGFMASLAPIVTDAPIVLLSLFLTQQMKEFAWFVGTISFAGSVYLLVLAYKILYTPVEDAMKPDTGHRQSSLLGAIRLNLLNPAPYVFWFSIGSAFIANASQLGAWIFAFCVTITLCLTKFLVAVLVKSIGDQLDTRIYKALVKSLAIPLIIFSVRLLYQGMTVSFA